MFLRFLHLRHFRCYSKASFEFSPGLNTIIGANAQGKTSLLEAIHFLMTGRSFRATQLNSLIQSGHTSFYIEAIFIKNGIEQSLKIAYGKNTKILYNNCSYTTLTSLFGLLPGVSLSPDDVSLIKGIPQIRRHFLDLQMAQTDPLYVHHLVRYHRAMRQRNSLLKNKKVETIEVWEQEMAHSANYVAQRRSEAIKELQTHCEPLHDALTDEKNNFMLTYKGHSQKANVNEDVIVYFKNQWKKHREKEMQLGITLTGPHKDDLLISVAGKEARFFASEGQQKSCVTSLRLAEWNCIKAITIENPLLLIDDFGLSLDANRKEKLLNYILELGQVFVSTTQEFGKDISQHVHKIDRTKL